MRIGTALKNVRQIGTARLLFLAALTLGHVVVHWYTQLLFLVLPSLKTNLGLSNVQVGTITTVQQGVFTLGTLPSGYLADSFQKRGALILASAIVAFGLGVFLLGGTNSYLLTLLAVALIGLGGTLWHPTALGHLSLRFPDRRGMALSIHGVGASVGDSLAPVAVGAFIVVVGWRSALVSHLVPAVLIALALWIGLGRMYREEGSRPSFQDYLGGLRSMLANGQVLAVIFSNSFFSMARLSVLTFLPLYIRETLGHSEFVLGIYLTLLYLLGMVSQPVMGIASDKFGRKVVIVPSFAVMGLLFIALAYVRSALLLGVVIGLLGLFFYAILNITQTAVMDVAGEHVQSSTMGVIGLVGQPFTLTAPIVAGYLVESFGIGSAFWFAGITALLAALILLPVRFRRAPATPSGH